YPLLAGTTGSRITFNVAFFVVLISLVVQGWTVAPAARRFQVQLPRRAIGRRLIELDAPGLQGRELVVFQLVEGARAAGMIGRDLPLPPNSRLMAIVRGDRLLPSVEDRTLTADDHVYLLAHSGEIEELEELFGRVSLQPAEQGFFGTFTLRGGAQVGEVAAFYDVELGSVNPELTLDEYLRSVFGHGVAVGDRATLGTLNLTVRAVEDGRVTRVGLQPRSAVGHDRTAQVP
ncbi:MAG: TrkA C-terminal domain-containing protein, partial [Halofilum sp. (in: g-proteobacteria)]